MTKVELRKEWEARMADFRASGQSTTEWWNIVMDTNEEVRAAVQNCK